MCDPERHITIDKVQSDVGNELLGCYFKYVTERDELFIYKFFGKDHKEKIGELHVGSRFDVHLGGRNFVLNIKASSCDMVTGFWTDAANWEPDQAYQAQAGGAVVDDMNAAAATAQ